MGRQNPDYVWYVLLTGGCVKWHLELLLLCLILYSRKQPFCVMKRDAFPQNIKILPICIGCQ